ncbi:MAG: ThuA domain-containing protein [Bryobacteraceae bacterium]|nr:ThuA domain-containing protein [Bryobacteraceae bacterium]
MRFLLLLMVSLACAADKNILLVAGKPSHPPGQHEHNAGVRLLTKWLNTVPGVKATATYGGEWPSDAAFDQADAILFFSDGGDRHFGFADGHPAAISKVAKRGAGLMFLHYAVEPPEKSGHAEMLEWLGGYFEPYYSINPHWDAKYSALPKHPVMNGVKPFELRDEWYYNMRFRDGKKGVTDLLVATPPASTVGKDGIRSGNAEVRKQIGQPQTTAWAYLRPGGGRSVGLTGGHFHKNLGDDNWRKVLLNGLLWVAKSPVPKSGVTVTVTPEELAEGLDPKPAPARKGD